MITHYNIITRAALIICMIFAANFTTHAQEDISDDEVVTDSLLTDTRSEEHTSELQSRI